MNLKEIAKAAGVSQSTVTMVLHGRKGVGDATKQRVAKLLEENGYALKIRQPQEQKLSSEPSKIIFIKYKCDSLMVDGNSEYITNLIDEVEKHCNDAGYELVFKVATNDTLPDIFHKVNNEPFEGIILLGTEFRNEDRPLLKNVQKPIIIIDNDLVKLPITSVSTHTWNSMRMKVEYLLRRGHKNIGYLLNSKPTSICSQCFDGFRAALRENNLIYNEAYVFRVEPTLEGAYESMKQILQKGAQFPSALVANSDCLALGAIRAMQEFGISVPKNVSIISGDNIASCTVCSPQLTTCDAHAKEIGKWAVTLLRERICNPLGPVIRLRVETSLVERESVCDYSDYVPFYAK